MYGIITSKTYILVQETTLVILLAFIYNFVAWNGLQKYVITCYISPLHTRSAGSGIQLLVDDIQVALILPAGTNPELHLKTIWAPPTVLMLCMFSMIPFSEAVGIPQSTAGRKLMVYNWAEDSPKFISYTHTQKNNMHVTSCRMICYLSTWY